jgi:general secretion pathway protein L
MMAIVSEAKGLFDEWIKAVAQAVDFAVGRYARRPQIALSGEIAGVLTARMISAPKGPPLPDISFRIVNGRPSPALPANWQVAFRGSRVETLLASDQVLFRPLDFPKQAEDFLEGMIRTQIDRLTPWPADEAVFGWSSPLPAGQERIELTLAATSRQEIEPLVQLATNLGARSFAAFAAPLEVSGSPEKITVFDQALGSANRGLDTPRLLRASLLSAGAAAAVALLLAAYVGDSLDTEQQQLLRRISERRAALRLGSDGNSAFGLLAKRKQTSPSSVVVLEALSKALPDGTYVTELRIDGDKVQVVGMTQDAPSLIRLIEKSPQFARATFFAPTTRAQNEPGERFHIEARITPSFGPNT